MPCLLPIHSHHPRTLIMTEAFFSNRGERGRKTPNSAAFCDFRAQLSVVPPSSTFASRLSARPPSDLTANALDLYGIHHVLVECKS